MEGLSTLKQDDHSLNEFKDDLILFVIGSTASGKTKLSLELARLLGNVEIINADSMQLYKGADIMTAKATAEEQQLVKHHLLDFLELEQTDFNRNMYFDRACPVIKDIYRRGKVPLIVGGTNYYIETLLFSDCEVLARSVNQPMDLDTLNANESITTNGNTEPTEKLIIKEESEKIPQNWLDLPLTEKYALLKKIDPLMADRLHPNDTRRVENYIKLYIDENILPSKKILEANQDRKLRFRNLLIFWPRWQDKKDLDRKIADRINEMVHVKGLIEIIDVFEYIESKGVGHDHQGAFQSIGYKEFEPFVAEMKEQKGGLKQIRDFLVQLKDLNGIGEGATSILEQCKQKLVANSCQYAKRQLTWINNRFAKNSKISLRLFELAFTTPEDFKLNQIPRALQIYQDWKKGKLPLLEDEAVTQLFSAEAWMQYFCDKCKAYYRGEKDWKDHLVSKRHRKTLEKEAKMKRNMHFIAQKQQERLSKQVAKEDEVVVSKDQGDRL